MSEEDLKELSRQGFVSSESRPGKPTRFKLRFRREGKQVVRYIAGDASHANRLRKELAELQFRRRTERRLLALTRQAKRTLRAAKRETERELNKFGFRFHGFAIRRLRTPGAADRSVL